MLRSNKIIRLGMLDYGLRIGEGDDITTKLYAKHTLQICEKPLFEAVDRELCQTAVISRPTVPRVIEMLFC